MMSQTPQYSPSPSILSPDSCSLISSAACISSLPSSNCQSHRVLTIPSLTVIRDSPELTFCKLNSQSGLNSDRGSIFMDRTMFLNIQQRNNSNNSIILPCNHSRFNHREEDSIISHRLAQLTHRSRSNKKLTPPLATEPTPAISTASPLNPTRNSCQPSIILPSPRLIQKQVQRQPLAINAVPASTKTQQYPTFTRSEKTIASANSSKTRVSSGSNRVQTENNAIPKKPSSILNHLNNNFQSASSARRLLLTPKRQEYFQNMAESAQVSALASATASTKCLQTSFIDDESQEQGRLIGIDQIPGGIATTNLPVLHQFTTTEPLISPRNSPTLLTGSTAPTSSPSLQLLQDNSLIYLIQSPKSNNNNNNNTQQKLLFSATASNLKSTFSTNKFVLPKNKQSTLTLNPRKFSVNSPPSTTRKFNFPLQQELTGVPLRQSVLNNNSSSGSSSNQNDDLADLKSKGGENPVTLKPVEVVFQYNQPIIPQQVITSKQQIPKQTLSTNKKIEELAKSLLKRNKQLQQEQQQKIFQKQDIIPNSIKGLHANQQSQIQNNSYLSYEPESAKNPNKMVMSNSQANLNGTSSDFDQFMKYNLQQSSSLDARSVRNQTSTQANNNDAEVISVQPRKMSSFRPHSSSLLRNMKNKIANSLTTPTPAVNAKVAAAAALANKKKVDDFEISPFKVSRSSEKFLRTEISGQYAFEGEIHSYQHSQQQFVKSPQSIFGIAHLSSTYKDLINQSTDNEDEDLQMYTQRVIRMNE